jgi:C4-dicarboxylate-specific signal transduction histidine kinase
MGQPWMSIFVGAVTPRQKTAFASEALKIIAALNDARAVINNEIRMFAFSPSSRANAQFCRPGMLKQACVMQGT